jgi:hypothetical protein
VTGTLLASRSVCAASVDLDCQNKARFIPSQHIKQEIIRYRYRQRASTDGRLRRSELLQKRSTRSEKHFGNSIHSIPYQYPHPSIPWGLGDGIVPSTCPNHRTLSLAVGRTGGGSDPKGRSAYHARLERIMDGTSRAEAVGSF